jgi:acyl-CoA dehydrogenase
MTWVLDETKNMLRDSAQAFLRERAPVAQLRALRDSADARGYSPALWQAFAEQGYCATLVPEAHGGLGLGVVEAGLIAEEMGHTLTCAPYLSTAVLAAWLLARAGSAAQQAQWLPRIVAGQAVLALAVDEQARHRPEALATRAALHGGQWQLDGEKCLVVDGHVADALIVAAQSPQGVVLLLVPAGAAGLSIERTVMVDSHNAARVRLDGVRVPADALVGPPQQDGTPAGAALLDAVLDVGRAVVAAELLGVADEAFARTLQYLKERRQFDRIIGEFQALQHRAAELWCDLELTRALVRQALQALDDAAPGAPLRVAQAKARAALTAGRAVQEAVQMHGGIGMTDELEIGFFMKRARVLQALFGDAPYHLDRAALLSRY